MHSPDKLPPRGQAKPRARDTWSPLPMYDTPAVLARTTLVDGRLERPSLFLPNTLPTRFFQLLPTFHPILNSSFFFPPTSIHHQPAAPISHIDQPYPIAASHQPPARTNHHQP